MDENTQERLSPAEAAKLIGVSGMTLWTWAKDGYGPQKFTFGRRKAYYLKEEVEEWIETNTQSAETSNG